MKQHLSHGSAELVLYLVYCNTRERDTRILIRSLSKTLLELVDGGIKTAKLLELDCSDTDVSDLSPLSACVNLLELDCSDTDVSDLSPLSSCVNLRTLYCRETKVSDLSPLTALTHLNIYTSYM